ncbi:hypothetical protein ACWD0A_27840 [Streptomyces sp. NPDC002867]
MATNVSVAGPDFIALQVRDVGAAAAFFETHLGALPQLGRPPVAHAQ